MALTLRINAIEHTVDLDDDVPLLWVVHDARGATGTYTRIPAPVDGVVGERQVHPPPRRGDEFRRRSLCIRQMGVADPLANSDDDENRN
jgi:hypothetical protein